MAEDVKLKIIIDTANSAKTVADIRKSLKDLRTAALQVEQGSEAFYKLSQAAGELQDKISDTQATANFFADDFGKFKGAIGIVEGLAGGFAVAQGAAALFGSESEELNEVLKKTQGAIALLNGLQAINAKLNKDSYERILLTTTATKAWNSSLVTSIRSLKGVQAAIAATGIGAIAIAVGLVVANWDKLNRAFKETGVVGKILMSVLLPIIPAFQGITALLEKFNLINNESKKSTKELTSELELQVSILESQGASFSKIFDIKKQILKLQATEIQQNIMLEDDEKKKVELQIELNKVLGQYANLLKEKSENEKKEAEDAKKRGEEVKKREEERLKAIDELNKKYLDSKIATMAEGEEKEIAMARENFRRKLAEIKGNSQVEKDIRAQLQLELNKTLSDIDSKYREEERKAREEAEKKKQEDIKAANDALRAEILLAKQNDTQELLLAQQQQNNLTQESVIANGEKLKELRRAELEAELLDTSLNAEQKRALVLKYQSDILAIEKQTAEQRQAIRDAELQAAMDLTNGLTVILNEFGKDSAEYAAFSKTLALVQIGIELAKSLGNLTTLATTAGTQAGVVAGAATAGIGAAPASAAVSTATYISGAAQILSAIAKARAVLQSTPDVTPPQFAMGGYVSGAGTATSDSIPAWLSNGEFVVNAKSTSVFAPLLDAINNITLDSSFMNARSGGNSVNKNQASPLESKQTIEVKAYVSEKEITDSQKRITKIERNGTIY